MTTRPTRVKRALSASIPPPNRRRSQPSAPYYVSLSSTPYACTSFVLNDFRSNPFLCPAPLPLRPLCPEFPPPTLLFLLNLFSLAIFVLPPFHPFSFPFSSLSPPPCFLCYEPLLSGNSILSLCSELPQPLFFRLMAVGIYRGRCQEQ